MAPEVSVFSAFFRDGEPQQFQTRQHRARHVTKHFLAMFRYHPSDPRAGMKGYEGSLTAEEEVGQSETEEILPGASLRDVTVNRVQILTGSTTPCMYE